MAALAVLAALDHLRRTGEGQRIEMAQTEAAAYLLGEVYLEESRGGRRVEAQGNCSDEAAPHGVYPCAGEDRWCAIAVHDDAWERLVRRLGWTSDARLASLAGRRAAREAIDERLAAWTRTLPPEEVAEILQEAGVSAMSVQGPGDHRGDAHLAERGAIVTLDHPEIGPARHIGNPIRLSRTPLRTASAAPLLGADTAAVLERVLGLSSTEVERLVGCGVCR
jgi:benzylsuccinate CoA-transferase BbsF subunit